MDFSQVKAITIPEGNVLRILSGSTVLWKKTRLPDEYQEVEYIEGSGTQYIDTGYYPNQNTKFEIRYLILEAGCAPAGVRWSIAPNSQTFGFFASASIGTTCYFGRANDNKYVTFANRNEYSQIADGLLDITRVSINTFSATVSRDQFVSTFPMYLFSLNIIGEASNPAKMRLYSVSISENGSTKREFVPCYRKIDRKPGLYDLANGVFYTNDGTGEFNVGADVIVLPDGYQRVEYIQSSGTQYIDTGVLATSGLSMDERMSYVTVPNDAGFVGTRKGNTRVYLHHTYPWKFGYGYNLLHSSDITAQADVVYNIHTDLSVGNQRMLVDSVEAVSGSESNIISLPYTIYIFCMNESNSPRYFTNGRLYSLTLYSDGEKIREFVPCYRKSDNVAGLYDLVNDVFYTNAGTGEFTVGPDV